MPKPLTDWEWMGASRKVFVRVHKSSGAFVELDRDGNYEVCSHPHGECLYRGMSRSSGYKRSMQTAKAAATGALNAIVAKISVGSPLPYVHPRADQSPAQEARTMQTMAALLKSWDVPHEVQPVARLARVLHRHAVHIERTYRFYNPGDVRSMKADASDLLDYARDLKLRRTTNW